MNSTAPRRYGLRRLAPFRGTLHTIAFDQARARTADGRTWRLELRAQAHGPGSDLGDWRHGPAWLPYGIWRDAQLALIPLDPARAPQQPSTVAAPLLQYLESNLDSPPYAFADCVELWLLDTEHQPLALLASQDPQQSLSTQQIVEWIPLPRNDFSFTAPSLSARGIPSEVGFERCHHRNELIRLVRRASAGTPSAQWFKRRADGTAQALAGIHLPNHLVERELPADAFPELPLRSHWPSTEARDLVRDFHAWQAPVLLTLPGLSAATRADLERSAVRQAELVAALHRLYPAVHDQDLITAALVEATLRQTHAVD